MISLRSGLTRPRVSSWAKRSKRSHRLPRMGECLRSSQPKFARMVFKCQDLKIRTFSEVPNPTD